MPKFLDVADFGNWSRGKKRCRIGVMDLKRPTKWKKSNYFFSPMLTGEYVSRIEKKAIEKLRKEFERREQ